MIGTTLSELTGVNLGVGFYYEDGQFNLNRVRTGEDEFIGELRGNASLTPERWRGSVFGIELGQFYALPEGKNSWAWALSAEYADRGDIYTGSSISTTAPRLSVFNRFSDLFRDEYAATTEGKKRQEVTVTLLEWFPAGYSADIGSQLTINIPFGEGDEERGSGEEVIRDRVSIAGYGISGGLFYDKDFYLTPKEESRNVFRITPIISFAHTKEEVNYDTSKRRFNFRDTSINIGIAFKVVYYVTQKFYFMMGWNPLLGLYSSYREAFSKTGSDEQYAETNEPAGKALLNVYSVAFGYDFTKNMSVYFHFGDLNTAGGAVSSIGGGFARDGQREQEQIKNRLGGDPAGLLALLSKITFGMDFRF